MQKFLLSNSFLLTAILLVGCGQSFNSNTEDKNLLPSSFCANQSDTRLCAANEIIQTKCTSCHTRYHATWGPYDTNAKWLASGNVISGNAAGSPLFTKLKNNGGNMPEGAPELTEAEAQAIRDWIDAI